MWKKWKKSKAVVGDIKSTGGEAIYVIVDMANLDEILKIFDATMDEYGTVDILFNNAGVLSMSTLMEISLE